MERPFVHALVYGQPGTEKSTFLSTWPKPMVVLATDPFGKEAPYLRRGTPDAELSTGAQGQPVRLVRSRRDGEAILVQIEYYHESDPDRPQAWPQLYDRLDSLRAEVFAGVWQTVVLDGVTMLEMYNRNWQEFSPHSPLRGTKEPRRYFGAATSDLERLLVMRFGALPCNVGVTAHVDSDKDEIYGTFLFSPHLPGRLKSRQEMAAAYTEVYRSVYDPKTGLCRLQTRPDERYHAMSTYLKAPNPCAPEYEALFANWGAG
jgi:hypothetical protein